MLNCSSMEEDEVEYFGTFANILVPLSQTTASCLSLHRKVFEEAQEAPILYVCRLCLHEAFHFFEIVENLMRLLHVVFVAGLEYAPLPLLIVKEAQLDLNIHWVFKLFDPLLHRSKVACEVIFRFLFDEREDYCQLVEEVVDCVKDGMQWQIGIR